MHYKTVKIGIGSAYDFFFEVARPNIDRFLSDPSPVTAINVAWPLWHLHDWYYWESHPSGNDQGRKAFARGLIKNECPELGWFRDIADAAKHLKLNRGSVTVDAILIRIYDGGIFGGSAIAETAVAESGRELSIEVAGVKHNLHYAIGAVSRFWLSKVLPHSVKFTIAPDNLERSESMRDWCRERLGDERCPRLKWAELQSANPPHYLQWFVFLEGSDAAQFSRDFQV